MPGGNPAVILLPPGQEVFTQSASRTSYALRIGFVAILLTVLLVPVRAIVMGYWPGSYLSPVAIIKAMIHSCYDATYVFGLAVPFIAIVLLVRKIPPRIAYVTFMGLATISLAISLCNIPIVWGLGRPLNVAWLYYADFFRSEQTRHALAAQAPWWLLAAGAGFCLIFALAAHRLSRWVTKWFNRSPLAWHGLTMTVTALLICLPVSHWYLKVVQADYHKLANPVVAFVESAITASKAPYLLTMATSVDPAEFAPPPADRSLPAAPGEGEIRNVIVVVLESVAAEYLGVYGSPYNVTPNLDRYAAKAAVFENAYAHAPSTNKTMVSLLCSTYPWLSFHTLTYERPDAPLVSLSSRLKTQGYATGFFMSARFGFQNDKEFLAHRGFDYIEDYTQRDNNRHIFSSRFEFLDGSDDASTFASMSDWIEAQQKPFLAVCWTAMTHYPYFTTGEDYPYTTNADLNRYLNALRYGDAAFGEMMARLEAAGLADSTLVVVVGDHGEAFGRHNQIGHGMRIYQENIHIPMLLINARRFAGERYPTIGGTVDVAPTIMHLLGLSADPQWQGRSLFDDQRSGRTYFFAPWSEMLYGYREGNHKFIYNATRSQLEVYDLSIDPQEMQDLSETLTAEQRQQVLERLAAWMQYQNRFFNEVLRSHP